MPKQFNFNYADSDIIDKYIRVTKKEPSDFKEGSLAMTELVVLDGVYAIVGRMIGDETNAIQSYLFNKDLWTKDQAYLWVDEVERTGELVARDNKEVIIAKIQDILGLLQDEMNDMPELASEFAKADLKQINGVEIFAAGHWNGDDYSVDDLHEMATSFAPLKDKLQPFVKLGHDASQKLIQKDGFPAAGWIENIYVKGNKLMADIVDIPEKIYDLIQNKAYKRISSEIYWNLKDGKKVYKRVLKAIALLGGDTPAVGSLADVQALYTMRYVSEIEADETKTAEYVDTNTKGDDEAMDKELEQANARIKEFEKEVTDLKATSAELETKNKDLSKKFTDLETKAHKSAVTTKVEELITNKKVLPAQKEYMIDALMKDQDLKSYSEEDKTLDDHPMIKMFTEGKEVVDTSEGTEEGKDKDEEVDEKKTEVAENIAKTDNYADAVNVYVDQKKGDES